jgi:hypothetical protein
MSSSTMLDAFGVTVVFLPSPLNPRALCFGRTGRVHSGARAIASEDFQDNGVAFSSFCSLKLVRVDMVELQGVAGGKNLHSTTTSTLTCLPINSFYTAFRDINLVEEPEKDHVCRCASFIESKDSG